MFEAQTVAEQNKQQFRRFQQKWANSIFYNQAIAEGQTAELYSSPSIDDTYLVYSPGDTCPYRFKANALGIKPLLGNGNRVIDLGGGNLDIDQILQVAYEIKRNRELAKPGMTVDRIDLYTDKNTSDLIGRTLIPYLSEVYGYENHKYWESGKVMDEHKAIGLNYNVYSLPQEQIELAVFTSNYFTDRITNFPAGGTYNQRAHSGELWIVDFADIDIGIVETNSVNRSYKDKDFGKFNEAWKCTMELNTEDRQFRSTTWTVRIGNDKCHAIFTNYNPDECPLITKKTCAATPAT